MTDDDIITAILSRESGTYTDRPADLGGPTKWGITIPTLSAARGVPVTPTDIQSLSQDEARRIYRARYILGPGFDLISNDALRALVVDTGVLHGPGTAARWLQIVLGVTADGVLGLETVGALSSKPLLPTFMNFLSVRIQAEVGRVYTDSSQLQFLRGWINRSLAFTLQLP